MTKLERSSLPQYTKGEEIFNMTSHIVGGGLGLLALIVSVLISALKQNLLAIPSCAVYGLGKKIKYMHSVFHLFVVAGSILQFICIAFYII